MHEVYGTSVLTHSFLWGTEQKFINCWWKGN